MGRSSGWSGGSSGWSGGSSGWSNYCDPESGGGVYIEKPAKFKRSHIYRVTNYRSDCGQSIQIDTDSFGVNQAATFKAVKNGKAVKKYSSKEFNFIYNRKKGAIYFNENGAKKGFGDGGIIAMIKGPDKIDPGRIEFLGNILTENGYVDKITHFNPSINTLDIVADSFRIDSSATFIAAKSKRKIKKLANTDFDFIYDKKKGSLYFNDNGIDKGFGDDGGIIAIIKGAPKLTSDNLNFI